MSVTRIGFLLLILLLIFGCGKEKEEPAPAVPTVASQDKSKEAAVRPEPSAKTDSVAAPASVQHTLSYAAGANGSITGATAQTVNHGAAGKAVTAVPAAGHHFVSWSDGSTANPRTDVDVTTDLAVTANFAVNQYHLTYGAGEHGSISGAGRQTVDHGGAGSPVTAVPAAGYHFVNWSDGVTVNPRTDSNVTGDLAVTAIFAINTYTVGGTLNGLADGTTVILQNNGGDDLALDANGTFVFAAALPEGQSYAVTVLAPPTSPNQKCTVTAGAGVLSGADIANVGIECRPVGFTIGGTVSGLPEGAQLLLRDNQGDELTIAANGAFTFAREVNDGSSYQVAIHSQQLKPKWSCSLDRATGKVAGSNITDIDVFCSRDVELQAVASLGRIGLKWNSRDFSKATFNLCRAREEIPAAAFDRCEKLRSGSLDANVSSPHTLAKLAPNVTYWLQLEVQHASGRLSYSPVVTAIPSGGLNDTGIDWCADNTGNRFPEGSRAEKTASCSALAASHPGQDALHGRDALARDRKLTKSGSGPAGFDYTRICMTGEAAGEGACPPNPSLGDGPDNWACTLDNRSGLMWEVKTSGGVRSQGNTYSWFNPNAGVNGGASGVQAGGKCQGSTCNTQAYVQAVNELKLCGAGDWRLPTRKELLSIVNSGRFNPAIDTGFFPNSSAAYVWTASPYADQSNLAWSVFFRYGEVYPVEKSQANQVRLVREPQ